MKLKVSLPSLQKPDTCPYPEPDESNPFPHTPCLILLVSVPTFCPQTQLKLSRTLKLRAQTEHRPTYCTILGAEYPHVHLTGCRQWKYVSLLVLEGFYNYAELTVKLLAATSDLQHDTVRREIGLLYCGATDVQKSLYSICFTHSAVVIWQKRKNINSNSTATILVSIISR
jgi:hypothetical protein